MTALRAVSIDLALRKTGLSWTHNHRGEPGVGTDTVICETTTGHPRIQKILTSVAAAVGCRPHIVAIESMYAGAGKGGTPLRLAEVHGVVTHWLFSRGIRYVYVEPQQIKIYATGNGNADKTDVQAAVTAEYGHLAHVADEHQADSLALLGLTAHAYGAPLTTVLNPKRTRAVTSITWPALGELS
ncbi:crossover junction endodeoxyribonuclease RuvC [Micromonospora sp. WMMD998]|uniref:crossover junction endodeoxyribonuclease RuvC n=1 Tax=Micromonospora sp. WMMD998 TaxID=3016092 RepID=UPI00249B48CD|nr:crossover junction endodeoxyribonuclease RuvC [Micromonospora sp. WMMD998]WFE41924.1 crossover junction endodeoxyribonuclease RuvC [Micromonospora sp. WMMD998]